MQISGRYIIPGEDRNIQFLLSCFQVSELQLYLLFGFICGLSLGCCPLLRCLILVVLFIEIWRAIERRKFYFCCQQVSRWSEVHNKTSTTEKISLQESRNGDSLTVDPIVVHSEVANASGEFPHDDHFEFDINDLKDQLGIDHIMQSLNALNKKLVGLGGVASLAESGNTAAKSDTVDSVFSHDTVFDPTAVI